MKKPKFKDSPTQFVANDRGHLLPGQPKNPGDCAWGHYVGTWDLPCHFYGNHVENGISRSKKANEKLQKHKELYDAKLLLAGAKNNKKVTKLVSYISGFIHKLDINIYLIVCLNLKAFNYTFEMFIKH